jgi:hypothetical protein
MGPGRWKCRIELLNSGPVATHTVAGIRLASDKRLCIGISGTYHVLSIPRASHTRILRLPQYFFFRQLKTEC